MNCLSLLVLAALGTAPALPEAMIPTPTAVSEHLLIEMDPATHRLHAVVEIEVRGEGDFPIELSREAMIESLQINGGQIDPAQLNRRGTKEREAIFHLVLPPGSPGGENETTITMTYTAAFSQDPSAGEQAGQIHNHSMSATIGEEGIFLSEGAAWHPRPLDEVGRAQLMVMSVDVKPMEGWSVVGSGEPLTSPDDLTQPVWQWLTPRPVEGMAIVGGKHALQGVRVKTDFGPVDVVIQVSAENEKVAPMFLEAAEKYLDLYTPLLGRFPYRRFTIVENFFSSGFAFPGFTLLDARVIAMAPRSLAPGYLDHELIHNWWGNGVYVDPDDGNWCEGLTSYCANYYRRIVEEGPEAGKAYRRDILMKLSADPEGMDDGPLNTFASSGSDEGPGRFVGYEKGAFVFMMLESFTRDAKGEINHPRLFHSLRSFAEDHLGKRANWSDLERSIRRELPGVGDEFFPRWVKSRTVPQTMELGGGIGRQMVWRRGSPDDPNLVEIDPDFYIYRVLPKSQLIPTLADTHGPGGMTVKTGETRAEVASYRERLEESEFGVNLFLIGREAAEEFADLLAKGPDPVVLTEQGFVLAGETYEGAGETLLHTMVNPDAPGSYITVFLPNGDAGWERLGMIDYYQRYTSVVWAGRRALVKRKYEPSRWVRRK